MQTTTNVSREIVLLEKHLPIRIFYGHDSKRSYIAPHFHEDIELIGLKKGTLLITDQNNQLTLQKGDIHIFNSHTIHSTLSEDPTMEAVILQISPSTLKNIFPDIAKYAFLSNLSAKDPLVTQLLAKMFTLLESTHAHNKFGYLHSYALIFELLDTLFTNFSYEISTKEMKTKLKYHERMTQLTQYIQQNYHLPLSLDELSQVVHLNPSYLSRFFKKYFGMTFFDYLTSIRLDHAYHQLLETELPIMDIYQFCGFQTYHQFNQSFKKVYGQTPSHLRKKAHE
ncbi:MAG: helix-turn-helix domain-containing protein [Enterococcus sp.]